ncbi:MAG: 3'(2'),5'-bisphosphate nucleotidase CysQ [Hyphomicrobium sp.]
MTDLTYEKLANHLVSTVLEAGRLILSIRKKGYTVDTKTDSSPVTEADKRVEKLLLKLLAEIAPHIPVIAEEEMASGQTPSINSDNPFFLIDPLDGTRDFCENRDDFTINVGLIENRRPTFGLIYAPARTELFLTLTEDTALFTKVEPLKTVRCLEDLNLSQIKVRSGTHGHLHALVSRSETKSEFSDKIKQFGADKITGMGSAIKFCLLARGDADIYPRFGATHEWDTAAGQAILEAAGGSLLSMDGSPFTYGNCHQKYLNGPFIARGRGHF